MSNYPKVVSVCAICGTEWIAHSAPSEEGTQCMVQRCYCHLERSLYGPGAPLLLLPRVRVEKTDE